MWDIHGTGESACAGSSYISMPKMLTFYLSQSCPNTNPLWINCFQNCILNVEAVVK